MGQPPSETVPETVEQLHAHNLQLILRSAHSFLAFHAPHIKGGRSLRILDLALASAIADLQELVASQPDESAPGATRTQSDLSALTSLFADLD